MDRSDSAGHSSDASRGLLALMHRHRLALVIAGLALLGVMAVLAIVFGTGVHVHIEDVFLEH